MPTLKAIALVVRKSDWSETSRIATLWSREFGRLRVLAKGGRRVKSNFESALDLLNVCSVVFIHKPSGGLDLLTEARIEERFPKLRSDLAALNCGYFIAELLSELTQDMDPHPRLFDEALDALRDLGGLGQLTGQRLLSFELTLLSELGYSPVLRECAVCSRPVVEHLAFSAHAGGVVCATCRPKERDARPFRPEWRDGLAALQSDPKAWRVELPHKVRKSLHQLLGEYIGVRMGKRPRLLPYLPN